MLLFKIILLFLKKLGKKIMLSSASIVIFTIQS